MTQEQINQAACNYANREDLYMSDCEYTDLTIEEAFLAGAESRQAEIDTLTADIEHYKQDISDGLKREEIARKVIEDKRGEVDELKEALQALYTMAAEGKNDEGALYNTQQILKKHSK